MAITVNADNLKSVLEQYSILTGKGIPELMRSSARLCAVELANRTQPFSVGKVSEAGAKAKIAGDTRTSNDIGKIIKTKTRLDEIFSKTKSEKLRASLVKLANAGQWQELKAVFEKVGFSGLEFISSTQAFKAAHKYNRSRTTGQTFKKADKVYIATSGLPTYIQEVVKRVGLSKSGWAECARKIGGVKGDAARGIPAFAKRHSADFGKVSENISGANTSFTMTNTIPWANKVCRPSEQRVALTTAKTKMIEQMRRAIKAAAKPKTDIKNIISQEVQKAA
jgi:hypothetical protein